MTGLVVWLAVACCVFVVTRQTMRHPLGSRGNLQWQWAESITLTFVALSTTMNARSNLLVACAAVLACWSWSYTRASHRRAHVVTVLVGTARDLSPDQQALLLASLEPDVRVLVVQRLHPSGR